MMKKILSIFKDLNSKDAIISLIIVALPFLFYTYKLIPDVPIWESHWFTINSGKWDDTRFLFWILNFKLELILILIIWLVTCRHWWRYVLFVPMIIELFKLRSIFDESINQIDELEFIHSLPFTIPVILFVLLISKRIGYFSKYNGIQEEINKEIDELIDELNILGERDIMTLKEEFDNLKNEKSLLSLKQYNDRLLKLRQRIVENI